MIEHKAFLKMEAELEKLLAEKHGLRSGRFEQRLAKALRRAPRSVRRAADRFVVARVQMGNPKLMRLMEPGGIDADFQILRAHFRAIDVADRRKGMVLSILGSLSFSLLVVFGLVMLWLVWRGFL
ncbi:hypothetical protein ACSSNL_15115 [Thalassobius sp. S69A]|uniref:hypothetical protein n=1 Tax=unclassified Thalassovita TaxID=2619711 RepID=UPI003C7AB2CE